MSGFVDQLSKIGPARLIVMFGVAAGVAAALLAVAMGVGSRDKALLFSQLDMTEAAEMGSRLDQAGIAYDFSAGGTALMVDADRVLEARMMLSAEGLPVSGSVGYEIFDGADFADQLARGARPQRVLWASTSTKNPAYSDVLYVEPLVGPNTVNTMPPATIDAYLDHGKADGSALASGVAQAHGDIDALGDLGIDFADITATLQKDGVEAFSASFDALLETVGAKMEALS